LQNGHLEDREDMEKILEFVCEGDGSGSCRMDGVELPVPLINSVIILH